MVFAMNWRNFYRWRRAQRTERQFWQALWDGNRQSKAQLILSEAAKQTFILQQLEATLELDLEEELSGKSVLDIGCGPVSYVARMQIPGLREGVDPLNYPLWVYENYSVQQFKVHILPFEQFALTHSYDVVVCYNALQHFQDLRLVGTRCWDVLRKGGRVIAAEYLDIPSDPGHIHVLTEESLHHLFELAGFEVKYEVCEARLPGLVEMGGGRPVKLFLGIMNKPG